MSKISDYRKSRTRTVTLPSGLEVTIRKPNLGRALLHHDLRPATREKIAAIGEAVLKTPKQAMEIIHKEGDEDVKAFLSALAADACIEPKFVWLESQAGPDAMWLYELDDLDQFELSTAIAGFMGVTYQEVVGIAPFRDQGGNVATEPADGTDDSILAAMSEELSAAAALSECGDGIAGTNQGNASGPGC